jgi:P27 family predicted phage terminase small subunit
VRGRKPKPTALRLIEGNREHRTIHEELEPKPEKKAPPCPRELKDNARKAWRYLVRELGKMGTLASSDRGQMTAYARAWGVWCRAERKLAELSAQLGGGEPEIMKTGIKHTTKPDGTVTESGGNWIQNPWFNVANKAMSDVVKYGAELGLNPVQRTRVKLERADSDDRRERLLS